MSSQFRVYVAVKAIASVSMVFAIAFQRYLELSVSRGAVLKLAAGSRSWKPLKIKQQAIEGSGLT
ncbi:MAG TPA: hypothetical protein V6C85_13545 [Allocoleopsis sp.]